MIDFHNHFLPGVDDGAKTLEESIEMLKFASEQGITEVVQTVHYQHPKMEKKNVDYGYLSKKIEELQQVLSKKNINIKLHLSAEVFYLPNLLDLLKNPLVTIGENKYMLIEFYANIYPTNYEKEFFKLQSNGITPIVAHPERYRFVKEDIDILTKWIDRDYVLQIDAGSIIGHFGDNTKDFSIEMIKKGYVHLIGSDAHNNKKRNFCLFESYKVLENILEFDDIEILKNNSNNILHGKKVQNLNSVSDKKNSSFNRIKKIFKF